MYIYNQEGRKEHIIAEQGRVVVAAQVMIVASHKIGTLASKAAKVTIKGVPKTHGAPHVALATSIKLNLTEIDVGTSLTEIDDAVATVIKLAYSSTEYIGITIQVVDDAAKTLKSIDDCYITWTTTNLITPGTNNTTT
jgi:hypothetical protein